MKKEALTLTAALALFVAAPLAAQAPTPCDRSGPGVQTCTMSVPVTLTVEHVLHLEVSQATTDFGSVGIDGFIAGPTIGVVANTDWDLRISSATPNFVRRDGQPSTKSIATLYTVDPSHTTYSGPMSVAGYTLASGTSGFKTVDPFDYYVYNDMEADAPGDYSAEIIFTLVGR